jgi:hypothetical protein
VSKNRIKQLHTLLVLHFNRCLTTEYSETTAHFNGNFDTDNQDKTECSGSQSALVKGVPQLKQP